MELRDYQVEASDAIIEAWRKQQSTLLVMCTGGGKTVIIADVIRRRQPGRTLVLAHREELIWQARTRIEETTGLSCEIEMADLYASRSLFHQTPVVIATVQSLISGKSFKRMGRFRPDDFNTLIIDESHHAVASSYTQILDYFKQNKEVKILGVTATPERADKESLGQIFGPVAFNYGIQDGIENGWLVPVTQQFVGVSGLDFSHVRTTAGDLNGADLAAVMEAERNIQGVCHPSLEVVYGLEPKTLSAVPVAEWTEYLSKLTRKPRRSIVFTASVAQAEMCCSILNRAMPKLAEWVSGKTPKDTRREILRRFATGETPVVVNCGVLTEGFDNPAVEVILMARPTKSLTLYVQMVGRSTRPLPGIVDGKENAAERQTAIGASAKPYCRIIDFVGNSGRHKLVNCFDVMGGKVSRKAVERSMWKAIESGKAKLVSRALTNEEEEIEKEKMKAAEEARLRESARRQRLIAKVKFNQHNVDPFNRYQKGPQLELKWRGNPKPLSERQRAVLRKRGVNPDRIHPAAARVLIGTFAAEEGWGKKKGQQ